MSLFTKTISLPALGRAMCLLGLALATLRFSFRLIHPVDNTLARLALLACLGLVLAGGILWIWSRKACRWAALLIVAVFGTLVLVPVGPVPDASRLRTHFVKRLEENLGKPFVWGAENRRAMDCSGLIRYSMRGAMRTELLATGNPRLLHLLVKAWWLDRAARDFLWPWNGLAAPVLKAATTPAVDLGQLVPGDVAVTGYGSHILAYLGDNRWIQADPERGRVVVDTAPVAQGWYKFPVEALRLKWE